MTLPVAWPSAFLEGDHYGTLRHELVTYGPIVLGKWLRGDDVTQLLPTLEGYFSPHFAVFTNGPGDERCELGSKQILASDITCATASELPPSTAYVVSVRPIGARTIQ